MPSRDTLEFLRAEIDAIQSGRQKTSKQRGKTGGDRNVASGKLYKDALSDASSLNAGQENQGAHDAASESESAFQKILHILNASDKSEKALRERLAQADFSQSAIDDAIDKAKRYAYVDDVRYAEVLIRSRLSQGKGSAGIERELASHNIDASCIEGWPWSFGIDESSELDRALMLLERKPPHSKNLRDGAYRKLVSKGYSSAIASQAARIWNEGASHT